MNKQNNPVFGKRTPIARPELKVLIVCEGEKTETNYFKAFDVDRTQIDVEIIGAGMNTVSLVKEAKRIYQEAKNRGIPYSNVWCVFDRDSFPPGKFNEAIEMARRQGFKAAYSNEAFELWYFLHFHYLESGLHRSEYKDKLTKCIGERYDKVETDMHRMLQDKQETAIANAQKLIDEHGANHNPEKDNPCTKVHELVKFLREYMK